MLVNDEKMTAATPVAVTAYAWYYISSQIGVRIVPPPIPQTPPKNPA